MALTDSTDIPRVALTIPADLTHPGTKAQLDTQWTNFSTGYNAMTPAQFSIALGIRINTLPQHALPIGSKCNCGIIYTNTKEFIDRCLTCDKATPKTHTFRHDLVKDAIINTIRSYGICTTREPTCFTYEDGSRK